jgi:hypothetical protein
MSSSKAYPGVFSSQKKKKYDRKENTNPTNSTSKKRTKKKGSCQDSRPIEVFLYIYSLMNQL